MSSEPTQPVPQWWQQPQGPKKDEGPQRDEGYPEDSQATRQYPTSQGSPAGPTFTPTSAKFVIVMNGFRISSQRSWAFDGMSARTAASRPP